MERRGGGPEVTRKEGGEAERGLGHRLPMSLRGSHQGTEERPVGGGNYQGSNN
jgi:hypothetical protein